MSIRRIREGAWRLDYRDVNGRRRRETFRTKQAAEAGERRALDQRDQGHTPQPRSVTIRSFYAEWEAETRPAVRYQTWRGYETNMRLYILPRLGDRKLGAIDTRTLQRFIDGLTRDGVRPQLASRIYSTLSVLLTRASAYGYCQAPQRRALQMPRVERPRFHVPTIAEVERLAEAIEARFRALVLVAGYCGLRQGELFGLHPDSIDWLRYRIRVWQTLERDTHKRIDSTKGGRERWVMMPQHVADALSVHARDFPCAEWVFHRSGEWVDATWFHHEVWTPARAAVDLTDVRFHDLRHACAAFLIHAGFGPKRVQAELGHADPAFTLRVYGHLFADEADTARLQLDQALSDALADARGDHAGHLVDTAEG